MNNVLQLPASNTMTPEQALQSALLDAHDLSDVIILGYRDGALYVRSSRMDRRDELWMAEMLRNHAQDQP